MIGSLLLAIAGPVVPIMASAMSTTWLVQRHERLALLSPISLLDQEVFSILCSCPNLGWPPAAHAIRIPSMEAFTSAPSHGTFQQLMATMTGICCSETPLLKIDRRR